MIGGSDGGGGIGSGGDGVGGCGGGAGGPYAYTKETRLLRAKESEETRQPETPLRTRRSPLLTPVDGGGSGTADDTAALVEVSLAPTEPLPPQSSRNKR